MPNKYDVNFDIDLDRPVYIHQIPAVLAKYGIEISKRRAIDIATQRVVPFKKCKLTGRLHTTERDLINAIFGGLQEARQRFEAERQTSVVRRRGRPRKNERR